MRLGNARARERKAREVSVFLIVLLEVYEAVNEYEYEYEYATALFSVSILT